MATTTKLTNASVPQQNAYNQALLRQQQLANQAKYMQMAQVDPYFTLGTMLGNAIASGMANRGIGKEKDAISSALANYQHGNTDYQALNNIIDRPNIANNNTLSATADSVTANGSPLVNVASPDTVATTNTALPEQSKNSVTINGDSGTSSNLGDFDIDKFKAQYYREAQARHRPQDQIDQAWAEKLPEIEALANKAKEARIDTALTAMTPNDKGEYSFGTLSLQNPKFISTLRPLMKDNPELATLLVNGAKQADTDRSTEAKQNALFGQQRYLQGNAQQFQAGQNAENNRIKMLLSDRQIAAAIAKAQATNGAKNAATGGITDTRYKNIATALKKLDEIEHGDGLTTQGRELTADERQQKSILTQQANMYLYGNNAGVSSPTVTKAAASDPNVGTAEQLPTSTMDYGALTSWVTKAIAEGKERGIGRERIERRIKDVLQQQGLRQDGDYVDQVLKEADWGSY